MDLTEMRARISMVNQCVEYECSLEAAEAILCPILVEAGEAMAETLCGMSLPLALSFGQVLQLQLSPSVQACFDKLVADGTVQATDTIVGQCGHYCPRKNGDQNRIGPEANCKDFTADDGSEWYDVAGEDGWGDTSYTCAWYAGRADTEEKSHQRHCGYGYQMSCCERWGGDTTNHNFGFTPNEACCACGGGRQQLDSHMEVDIAAPGVDGSTAEQVKHEGGSLGLFEAWSVGAWLTFLAVTCMCTVPLAVISFCMWRRRHPKELNPTFTNFDDAAGDTPPRPVGDASANGFPAMSFKP
jgi:hypothetical protein